MDLQAHVMADAVDEVPAQRVAMQVLAVRVDVIVGDFVQAVGRSLADRFTGPDRRDGGFLRAQHDLVDLALPLGELTADGDGAGDIRV